MGITAKSSLDTADGVEVYLELLSFSGGENVMSEDHITQNNEARVMENWEAISLGGMQRVRGFNEVASQAGTDPSDLAHFHYMDSTGNSEFLGVIAGDLVKKDGAGFTTVGASAFTSGVLCHATEGVDECFITNAMDGLKKYTIAGGVVIPADCPDLPRERIYRHKNRLVAEGGGPRIYGSRVGTGNWNNPTTDAVVFTGSGLNDGTSGGTYTGTGGTVDFEVEIDATGTPDTFKWKKGSGSYTTGVAITGSEQTLSDGITITFAATTGHTLANKWAITITADAWSLANDAWSLDLPNNTKGCAIGFPSGDVITAFDEFRAYLLSGFPNTRFDPIANSRGCSAPYSIAVGDEGVFFLSKYPTLGIFLWTGTEFIDLTKPNEDSFVQKIDFSKRIFGIYRNRKYYVLYCEKNSGVTYPNRMRVYNAKFGSWYNRPVNPDLSDNFGYPALLTKQNNELYVFSSQKEKIYDLETDDNSDEGNATEASYKTKDFTSADFLIKGSGKSFPIDEAIIKLTKITMTYYGTTGVITAQWTADRGRVSGSQTFDLSAGGDLLNTTFEVNTSDIIAASSIGDKKITKSVKNSSVGRTFNFQFLNSGTSTRPKIKKIKIHGIISTED